MQRKFFITSIYLNEINLWFRLGSKCIDKNKLVPVSISKDKKLTLSKANKEKFISFIPDYEDDFEVILVVLSIGHDSKQEKSNKKIQLSFRQIEMILPTTERGKNLLSGKIDSRIILAQPQFANIFSLIKSKLDEKLCRIGGDGLLEIFRLKDVYSFATHELEILEALKFREVSPGQLNQERSLMFNAVIYDRSKPFPKGDIGYFYDLGAIIKCLNVDEDQKLLILREYSTSLERKKAGQDYKKVFDMIMDFDTEGLIDSIEKLTGTRDFISSVLFIMLVSEYRQGGSIKNTRILEVINNEFLRLNYSEEVAKSIWLTGYFLGFENVSDIYYEMTKPKALFCVNDLESPGNLSREKKSKPHNKNKKPKDISNSSVLGKLDLDNNTGDELPFNSSKS